MTSDKVQSQDILQESFIKVFRQLRSFKGKSTLGAWIKKICINTAISELRKDKKFQFVELVTIVFKLCRKGQELFSTYISLKVFVMMK